MFFERQIVHREGRCSSEDRVFLESYRMFFGRKVVPRSRRMAFLERKRMLFERAAVSLSRGKAFLVGVGHMLPV